MLRKGIRKYGSKLVVKEHRVTREGPLHGNTTRAGVNTAAECKIWCSIADDITVVIVAKFPYEMMIIITAVGLAEILLSDIYIKRKKENK